MREWRGSPTSAPWSRSWTSSKGARIGASATFRRRTNCATATATGIASRRCVVASTRRAALPTPGPSECWGAPRGFPPREPMPEGALQQMARAPTRGDAADPEPYARLEAATAQLQAPFALVDLDALQANAAEMVGRADVKPIRLASKSVRCRGLQTRVLEAPGYSGTLAYTLPEALWLASHGVEDLVVAYPTADVAAVRELVEGPREAVTVMVDSVEQLTLIERAIRGR